MTDPLYNSSYRFQEEIYSLSISIGGKTLSQDEIQKHKEILKPLIAAILDNCAPSDGFKDLTITASGLNSNTEGTPATPIIEMEIDHKGPKSITDSPLNYLQLTPNSSSIVSSDTNSTPLKITDVFRNLFPVLQKWETKDEDEEKISITLKYDPIYNASATPGNRRGAVKLDIINKKAINKQ